MGGGQRSRNADLRAGVMEGFRAVYIYIYIYRLGHHGSDWIPCQLSATTTTLGSILEQSRCCTKGKRLGRESPVLLSLKISLMRPYRAHNCLMQKRKARIRVLTCHTYVYYPSYMFSALAPPPGSIPLKQIPKPYLYRQDRIFIKRIISTTYRHSREKSTPYCM